MPDPEMWKALAAMATAVAGVGGWFGGKKVERNAKRRTAEREILVDEGENGDATLRKMVRQGFDDLTARVDRTQRDVNGLWELYDRQARELRTHEKEEEQAFRAVADSISELGDRIDAALPPPPPGIPERRAGRRQVT